MALRFVPLTEVPQCGIGGGYTRLGAPSGLNELLDQGIEEATDPTARLRPGSVTQTRWRRAWATDAWGHDNKIPIAVKNVSGVKVNYSGFETGTEGFLFGGSAARVTSPVINGTYSVQVQPGSGTTLLWTGMHLGQCAVTLKIQKSASPTANSCSRRAANSSMVDPTSLAGALGYATVSNSDLAGDIPDANCRVGRTRWSSLQRWSGITAALGTSEDILRLVDRTGQTLLALQMRTDGILQLTDAGARIGMSTTVGTTSLPNNATQYIALAYDSQAGGAIVVWLNGTQEISTTHSNRTTAIDSVRTGSGPQVTYLYDDIGVIDLALRPPNMPAAGPLYTEPATAAVASKAVNASAVFPVRVYLILINYVAHRIFNQSRGFIVWSRQTTSSGLSIVVAPVFASYRTVASGTRAALLAASTGFRGAAIVQSVTKAALLGSEVIKIASQAVATLALSAKALTTSQVIKIASQAVATLALSAKALTTSQVIKIANQAIATVASTVKAAVLQSPRLIGKALATTVSQTLSTSQTIKSAGVAIIAVSAKAIVTAPRLIVKATTLATGQILRSIQVIRFVTVAIVASLSQIVSSKSSLIFRATVSALSLVLTVVPTFVARLTIALSTRALLAAPRFVRKAFVSLLAQTLATIQTIRSAVTVIVTVLAKSVLATPRLIDKVVISAVTIVLNYTVIIRTAVANLVAVGQIGLLTVLTAKIPTPATIAMTAVLSVVESLKTSAVVNLLTRALTALGVIKSTVSFVVISVVENVTLYAVIPLSGLISIVNLSVFVNTVRGIVAGSISAVRNAIRRSVGVVRFARPSLKSKRKVRPSLGVKVMSSTTVGAIVAASSTGSILQSFRQGFARTIILFWSLYDNTQEPPVLFSPTDLPTANFLEPISGDIRQVRLQLVRNPGRYKSSFVIPANAKVGTWKCWLDSLDVNGNPAPSDPEPVFEIIDQSNAA